MKKLRNYVAMFAVSLAAASLVVFGYSKINDNQQQVVVRENILFSDCCHLLPEETTNYIYSNGSRNSAKHRCDNST